MADSNDIRIYQQIEQTADYYGPGVYNALLTHYQSLSVEQDPLSQDFIPISSAPQTANSRQILFAVGIIPPSSYPSGKLLDRSASIAADGGQVPAADIPKGSVGGGADKTVPGAPNDTGVPSATMYKLSPKQAARAIREAYFKQTGRYPSDDELAIYVAHSNRETSLNWPDFNPGFVGNAGVKTPRPGGHDRFYWPPTKTTFYSYPTAQDGGEGFLRFIPGNARKAAQSGDINAYSQALADVNYFGKIEEGNTVEGYAKGFGPLSYWKNQIGPQSALDSVQLPEGNTAATTSDPSVNYNTTGSTAAKSAQKQISNSQTINLNNTEVGRKYAQAQAALAREVQAKFEAMANTPPLRLLVNPTSFKVSNEKVINDGNWTRSGPVIEHWGDNQDKIDASGKVAAFMALDANNATGPGLTRTARNFSASYQNLMSLYQLYRNNAGIYVQDTIEPAGKGSAKTNLVMSGSIYIYYDHTLYIGSFDSFTITETDTAPYTLEYNFSFTVRATFLLDEVADQRFTYGIGASTYSDRDSALTPTASDNAIPTTTPATADPVPVQPVRPRGINPLEGE